MTRKKTKTAWFIMQIPTVKEHINQYLFRIVPEKIDGEMVEYIVASASNIAMLLGEGGNTFAPESYIEMMKSLNPSLDPSLAGCEVMLFPGNADGNIVSYREIYGIRGTLSIDDCMKKAGYTPDYSADKVGITFDLEF